MVSSSSKRSKQSTSGFPPSKRLKARVGKRALKPANVTDTSFRAVSLHTANQSSLTHQASSLEQLTCRLNHVSSTVRKAALVGILNLSMTTENNNNKAFSAFTSLWIPPVSKCACVDEDDSVRDAGYNVLEFFLLKKNKQQQSSSESCLRPFVPIMVAYIASALTSLDPSIRFHACRVLYLVCTCTTVPTELCTTSLLPSFGLLLQDASQVWNKECNTQRKGNKNKDLSQENSKRCTILQALVSLLLEETATPAKQAEQRDVLHEKQQQQQQQQQQQHAHYVFVPGAKNVTNGVLIANRQHAAEPPIKLSSIQNLEVFQALHSKTKPSDLSIDTLMELLERLRDLYVELQQQGSAECTSSSAGCLEPQHLQELSLLVVSIRLVWNQKQGIECKEQQQQQQECLDKLASQCMSLLLESFPVVPPQHSNKNALFTANYKKVHSEMCCTLMDMGTRCSEKLRQGGNDNNWIKQVLGHIMGYESDFNRDKSNDMAVSGSSATMMEIMARFVLLRRQNGDFALDEKVRCKVLQHVCKVYFDNDEADLKIFTSPAGRRAVRLVVDLVKLENEINEKIKVLLRRALQCFPNYLKAWHTGFMDETAMVLSCLVDVTRRHNENDSNSSTCSIASSELITALRTSIGTSLFFVGAKKKKSGMLFEKFPSNVQRLVMSFIGMLQSPPQQVLDGLSHVCATRETDKQVLDFIFHVMHTIRRTVSMQAYLGFLISSTGIGSSKKSSKRKRREEGKDVNSKKGAGEDPTKNRDTSETKCSPEVITAHDDALRRTCRALCLCGSSKVLPAVAPVFTSWIGDGACLSEQDLVRARAALSILASLALDLKSCNDGTDSVLTNLPNLFVPITQAICNMMPSFLLCGPDKGGDVETFHHLMRPAVALICCEPRILSSVFEEFTVRLNNNKATVQGEWEELVLRALVALTQCPRLVNVVRDQADTLGKTSVSIEAAVANGQHDRLGGTLRTSVQILVGHAPAD